MLLDWREDLGNLEHGDIYYDLGKIYHALIITHKKIREKNIMLNLQKTLHFINFLKEEI